MKKFLIFTACLFLIFEKAAAFNLTEEDKKFIDMVEKKAFDFFWEQADPKTGLIKDQTNNFGEDESAFKKYRASIASVGFGLSACEAPPPRGYNRYGEAEPALADTPNEGMRGIDGTVAIHAAGGSMPFTPKESMAMMPILFI